jgi:hypothetical protein
MIILAGNCGWISRARFTVSIVTARLIKVLIRGIAIPVSDA